MKHSIESKPDGLNITIKEVGDSREKVLSALQECAEGRCSCPTPQYAKLEGIDIKTSADSITVRLQPKPDQVLDVGDIEKCLTYTEAQAKKD